MKWSNAGVVYGLAGWCLNLARYTRDIGVAAASSEKAAHGKGPKGSSLQNGATTLTSLRGHISHDPKVSNEVLETADSTIRKLQYYNDTTPAPSSSSNWNYYQTPSHVPTPLPSTYSVDPSWFVDPSPCLFELLLQTDSFGHGTSWDLLYENTGLVIAGSFNETYANDMTYKFEECLTEQGTYRFTIYDSFGDGITYGSYEVRLGGYWLASSSGHGFNNETVELTYEPQTASPSISLAPSASPTKSHAPSISSAPTQGMISGEVALACLESFTDLQGSHHDMYHGNVTQTRSNYVMDFVYQCNYGHNQEGCTISMNFNDALSTGSVKHNNEEWRAHEQQDDMDESFEYSSYYDEYNGHYGNPTNSSAPSNVPVLEVQLDIDFSAGPQVSSWSFREFVTACYKNGGHLCSASMTFDILTNLTRNPAYGPHSYYNEYYADPHYIRPKSMFTHFIPTRFFGNVTNLPICTVPGDTGSFDGFCSEEDTASLASIAWSTVDLKAVYEQFIRYNYYDLMRNGMGHNGYYYPHRFRELWTYDYAIGVFGQFQLEEHITCYNNIMDILSDVGVDEVCLIDTHALISRDNQLHVASEAYFDLVQYDCSNPVSSKACNPYSGAWEDPLMHLNVTQNIYLNFTSSPHSSSYDFDYALERFKVACEGLGYRPGFAYEVEINQTGTPDMFFHIEHMPLCLPSTCREELALAEATPEWLTCVMYGGVDGATGNERCTRSFSGGVSFNSTATYVKDDDTCRRDIGRMSSNLELIASWNGLMVQALTQCKSSGHYGHHGHYGGGTYEPICRVENTTDVDSVEIDYIVDFTQFDDFQEYHDFEASCFETTALAGGTADSSLLFCEAWISVVSSFREYSTNVQINGLIEGFPLCYAPSCRSSLDNKNETMDDLNDLVLNEDTLMSLMEHFFLAETSSSSFNSTDGANRRLSKFAHPIELVKGERGLQSEEPFAEKTHYYDSANNDWPTPSPTRYGYYPTNGRYYDPTQGGYYNYGGVEFTILRFDCRDNANNSTLIGSTSPSDAPTDASLFVPEGTIDGNDASMVPSGSPSKVPSQVPTTSKSKKGKSSKTKKASKGKGV